MNEYTTTQQLYLLLKISSCTDLDLFSLPLTSLTEVKIISKIADQEKEQQATKLGKIRARPFSP